MVGEGVGGEGVNERDLYRGYHAPASPVRAREMVECPGFRMRGCLTRIPDDRYLCHFCRGTAKATIEAERGIRNQPEPVA